MSALPVAGRTIRVWVTRPAEDALDLADALRAEGIEPVTAPLLEIAYDEGPPLDLRSVQALLVTSANGVRAFARRNPERDLPLLAVGDATARTARALGFVRVESASGDVAALADLARRHLDPQTGPVLHVAAGEVAGDLAGALTQAGFTCRREILYRAHQAHRLPQFLVADLLVGRIDGVVLFSPRTARVLVRLLQAECPAPGATQLACFCLSGAVAQAASGVQWRSLVIAERPTQASLLSALLAAQH